MKAVLCRQFGPLADLRIEEVDPPAVRPGQIAVRILACGINFYDGLAVQGKYQTKPPFPFSPGGEVAGIVSSVGVGVAGFREGQRVLAFTGFGGYADQVAVDARFAFPIPDSMDFEVAAALPIAYGTSYHALKDRAQLRSGETLLVLGAAGGVGLTAVELGKALGARVIAAASSADKLSLCRDYGADATINYAEEDLRERVKALTEGRGVDVVYDPIGGTLAEVALHSLTRFGRHLVIGFASGDIPQIAFNRLLLKQVSVMGVLWGAFAQADPASNAKNMADLLALHRAGRIRPHISESYPLDRFEEALGRVMDRKAKGKVVLQPRAGARSVEVQP
jgi:NADPH2:quinone reductase